MTPVALMTGRNDELRTLRSSASTAPFSSSKAGTKPAPSSSPEEICSRNRAITERMASVTAVAPCSSPSAANRGARTSSSTDGNSRNNSDFPVLFIRGLYTCVAPPCHSLKSMQICQQILQVLRAQFLAEAGHLTAPQTNDIADPLIGGRQPTQRKIFALIHAFQTGALLASRGIRLVAAATLRIVNLSPGRLLRVQPELRIGFAPFHIAGDQGHKCQHGYPHEKESYSSIHRKTVLL